jgi:hypothetical protein
MTRRIVIILVSALAILGLMFLLWFWFFSGRGAGDETGTFGTGEDATRSGVGVGGGNQLDQLPGQGGETGTTETNIRGEPIAIAPEPVYTGGRSNFGSGVTYTGSYIYTPNVVWLDGSYTIPPPEPIPSPGAIPGPGTIPGVDPIETDPGGEDDDDDDTTTGGGSGVLFDPTDINDVTDASISGRAYFNFGEEVSENELDAAFGVLGLGVACLADYVAQRQLAGIVNEVKGRAEGFIADIPIIGAGSAELVYDADNDTNQITTNVIDCIVRSLARAAIQAITAQTVEWINNGFDGKPAFVENFNEFFNKVADQAAGEFIQGSALSFLCSPFQAQVRIAIATSYAQRNVAPAQTCTLSDVVDNVEGVVQGNFADGGWPGLISFTSEPSNNPFGAYMTAQARLNNAVIAEVSTEEKKISPGGYLAQEECDPPGSDNCNIVTPGSTIEASLESTLQANLDSLQLADSVDAILSALQHQLMTKVLYEGLGNLKPNDVADNSNAMSPEERAANKAAQALFKDLKAALRQSERYGAVQQGSIRDIQTIQSLYTDLQNCWIAKGNAALAGEAAAQVTVLERRVTIYNQRILDANQSIARIQRLHTDTLTAQNENQVDKYRQQFENRTDKGRIYTKEDLTTAQQDRDALQREMDALETSVSNQLAQCNAS